MNWKKCRRCGLWAIRRNVVYGSGQLPADILFVGEAPGKEEDLLGEPFVGPSGRLLRRAISDALRMAGKDPENPPTIYITNIVACRPSDSRGGPNRAPIIEESNACSPRLAEIASECKPRLVVLLGKVAQRECHQMFPRALALVHPAFLLRSGGINSEGYLPFVRKLSEVL